MSRTRLCVGTASGLAVVVLLVMAARWAALGGEVFRPAGPGTWHVTLVVRGKQAPGARLTLATPLESGRQHVLAERSHSDELAPRGPAAEKAGRRDLGWEAKPGRPAGEFTARYECDVTLRVEAPAKLTPHNAPPKPNELLAAEGGIEPDHPEVASLARRLCTGQTLPAEQAEVLFQFVDQEVINEPGVADTARGAVECLRLEGGSPLAKARLLASLLRSRALPARLVAGVPLGKPEQQPAHWWVEAWLGHHWVPMDPFYHHYGRVPHYLVFGYGDRRLVQGHEARPGDLAFLVEKLDPDTLPHRDGWVRRAFAACSLAGLRPGERHLAEFLLLVPLGALVVCVFRTLVGLVTFGTFAPAILGLAFRELHCVPGLLIFVSILLVGWLMRRGLDRFNLLQVPRTALMLSLVIGLLVTFIALASWLELAVTRYVALFPMVILTGMIERFWTLEEEDGAAASFKTLLATLGVAAVISLVVSFRPLTAVVAAFPETLGLVMAGQLLLGRYTGYRLTELVRFREMLGSAETEPVPEPVPALRVFSDRAEVGGGRI
jgi:hypothetical protein